MGEVGHVQSIMYTGTVPKVVHKTLVNHNVSRICPGTLLAAQGDWDMGDCLGWKLLSDG